MAPQTYVLHFTCSEMLRLSGTHVYHDGWWPWNEFCFLPGARPSVSQYDLHVCLFVKKFFCFWMCLPIAVAPCSLRVLFAAPFKERLKAHLICKAPQFPKNPTQPLSIPEQTAILPFSPSRLSGHAARSTETAGRGGKNATPSHPISRALWRRSGRVYRRDG